MIKMILMGFVVTLSLSAQEKADEAKSQATIAAASEARAIAARVTRIPKQRSEKAKVIAYTSDPSLTNSEVFSNLVIAPGQTLVLASTQDWTGADHMSIAVECPSSTSLLKVGIVVAWSVAIANFYTITDVILGSSFLLSYQGGAVVPTYGNMMQAIVVNNGTTSVSCDQLTLYAVVH